MTQDLTKLFKQAGISEEDFVKYFLEPAYPQQNPVVIDGIVYTEESDGIGETKRVRQGAVEEVLEDNMELAIIFFKEKDIEEEVFIEWMAHHKTSTFDEKGEQKTQKQQQGNFKRLLGGALAGLMGLVGFSGGREREEIAMKEENNPSTIAEGRNLADEEMEMEAEIEESEVEKVADFEGSRVKKTSEKLKGEINIIDAVYDNLELIQAIHREAKQMEIDEVLSVEDHQAAKKISGALSKPEQVKGVGVTADNDLVVEYKRNDDQQKQAAIIRMTSRLGAIRQRIVQAAQKMREGSMDKALSGAGKLSLGAGGKDAKGVERSETPNDEKVKGKESRKEIT